MVLGDEIVEEIGAEELGPPSSMVKRERGNKDWRWLTSEKDSCCGDGPAVAATERGSGGRE